MTKFKQAAGVFFISLPFLAILFTMLKTIGITGLLIVFASVIAMIACIVIGTTLLRK